MKNILRYVATSIILVVTIILGYTAFAGGESTISDQIKIDHNFSETNELTFRVFISEDSLSLIIPIITALAGWLILILLENHKIKEEIKLKLQNQALQEIVTQINDFNHASTQYGTSIIMPPMVSIKYGKIADAPKKWQKHIEKMMDKKEVFSSNIIKLWQLIERWQPVINKESTAIECIIDEFQKVLKKSNSHFRKNQVRNAAKFPSWNIEKIETENHEMNDCLMNLAAYLNDLQKLLTKALLGKVFKHKMQQRKVLIETNRVLTSNGLELIWDDDEEKYKKLGIEVPEIVRNKNKKKSIWYKMLNFFKP